MTHTRRNPLGTAAALFAGLVPLFAGCGAPDAQNSLPSAEARVQIGTVASALVNPKTTEVTGFGIPDALLELPQRTVITSASEATRVLGSVPTGVDFAKEYLVFYAAGRQPTLGFRPSVTIGNTYVERQDYGGRTTYRLQVDMTTLLDPPGTGCAAERPGIGRPFTLVRVDATGLRNYALISAQRMSFQHTDNKRTCASEPGLACDGTVTTAGLEAIQLRPGGSTPTYTTNRSYADHLLGSFTVERWKWDCKAGACSWLFMPQEATGLGYLHQGNLYYYTSGSRERLAIFSSEWFSFFYSSSGVTYPCWQWGEDAFVDLDTKSGTGVVSSASLLGHQVCSVAVAGNYHSRDMGMNDFSGVMGDRCARLTTREGGPGPGEVIQVLTSTW